VAGTSVPARFPHPNQETTATLAERARVDRHKIEAPDRPRRLSAHERWRLECVLWDERAEALLASSDLPRCEWRSNRPRSGSRKEASTVVKRVMSCPTCEAPDRFARDTLGVRPFPPFTAFLRGLQDFSYEAPFGTRVLLGVTRGLFMAVGASALVVGLSLLLRLRRETP
jgi:hypothetical protein